MEYKFFKYAACFKKKNTSLTENCIHTKFIMYHIWYTCVYFNNCWHFRRINTNLCAEKYQVIFYSVLGNIKQIIYHSYTRNVINNRIVEKMHQWHKINNRRTKLYLIDFEKYKTNQTYGNFDNFLNWYWSFEDINEWR